ncbi:hypothetical protein [Stakelama marina]|uniref:Secreted protein n=1 Tax=Stakelama marina TaxID=2826939 RepID=A0A8T4IDP9_9SPHN|nr:hypothetical protein [Stakelama marina]MBR0552541.1 hypothetical protein [Stakelama marina]
MTTNRRNFWALWSTVGACALLFAVAAGHASAQQAAREPDTRTVIEQIAPPARGDRAVPPSTVKRDKDVEPGEQLSGDKAAREAVSQLSTEKKTADAGHQLYRGKRTAQSSTPLSTPAQGRKQEVVRLKGDDRCDPAEKGARQDPDCANVIETRSAEYARPDPTELSPEQRLLIYQRAREEGVLSSRPSGHAPLDPDNPDAQSVASLVLPRDQTDQPAKKPADDASATDQAVLDIVQAITQQAPPPQQ